MIPKSSSPYVCYEAIAVVQPSKACEHPTRDTFFSTVDFLPYLTFPLPGYLPHKTFRPRINSGRCDLLIAGL